MVGEQFLTEEEILRKLKINKAQLQDFVRQGKLTPTYQEGIRKFKQSEISQIAGGDVSEPTPPPPKQTTPPPPSQPAPPKVEGSTRVIEPPKEVPKIRIRRKEKAEKEVFLQSPAERMAGVPTIAPIGIWVPILLIIALLISAFAMTTMYFNLTGKRLPTKIGSIQNFFNNFSIRQEESKQIQEEANGIIEEAKKAGEDAEALSKDMLSFIQR